MTGPFRDDSSAVVAAERKAERLRLLDAQAAARKPREVEAFEARAVEAKRDARRFGFVIVLCVAGVLVLLAVTAFVLALVFVTGGFPRAR